MVGSPEKSFKFQDLSPGPFDFEPTLLRTVSLSPGIAAEIKVALIKYNHRYMVWVQPSVHLPLTSNINKSQQRRKKFSGTMMIEPGAAGCEARMLPMCYAATHLQS